MERGLEGGVKREGFGFSEGEERRQDLAMVRKVDKNMKFAGNMIITETIVLTYIHLKFFLSQV